jgi:hypothetical protein
MKQIETDEWIYKGCFIQLFKHPVLFGKYTVFKNNQSQTHIGRFKNIKDAKRACIENECKDNYLKF